MNPLIAVTYSFLFGLLHGILPDEHTWPITFSYAIGGGSGKEGMKAGLYFSLAFAVQRAMMSELAYLALVPVLMTINRYIYLIVGLVMFIAGAIVLKRNTYPHLHLLGHHHRDAKNMETNKRILSTECEECEPQTSVPPVKWTLIHGFVAGFAFGGFSLFVMTVAAPAMPGAWLGFLPGLVFGLGTMLMLVVIGALFGMSLKWAKSLTEADIKKIGSETGGRTLFFGGLLFMGAGMLTLMGIEIELPFVSDYTLISVFMIGVAIPAFVYSYRQVVKTKKQKQQQ
ncbi:MAG: sulfite exporter TauE/SafE family protein [Deltaproteobacteria bacterium]|nr:sulfite exporter TauE/SafE family protein [Deltaproteobacteria bacterium]MCL5278221.1 sulfite exporter TauE/SafE family protein [Deltaproteobacteria bacterium]